ncbi:hypothetical protein [Mucisphaera sp.]|uniref:hypothetical protein n=1 Tax=Mucisphaera sp. TaxID=2913024 RepID=UPI003D144890
MAANSKEHLSFRRSAVLSGVMVLLFLGTLGVASLVTPDEPSDPFAGFDAQRPTARPQQSTRVVPWVNLAGMSFALPPSWSIENQETDSGWDELTTQSITLQDPTRPTRRLRIGTLENLPEGTTTEEVYLQILGEHRSRFEPLETNLQPFHRRTHSGAILLGTVDVEIQTDEAQPGTPARSVVAMAVMSINNDGRTFWIVWVSDLVPFSDAGNQLAAESFRLVSIIGPGARPTESVSTEPNAP